MIRAALAILLMFALYACTGTLDYAAMKEMGIPSLRIQF